MAGFCIPNIRITLLISGAKRKCASDCFEGLIKCFDFLIISLITANMLEHSLWDKHSTVSHIPFVNLLRNARIELLYVC